MSIKEIIGHSLFWFGLGVLVHDYAHQVYELKGYHNLLEGGYIGLAFLILGYIIILYQYRNLFKQKLNKLLRRNSDG